MLQCIINGILLGGIYATIGIGMSLVFGIMRLTNLAHGDLMILATYFSMIIMKIFGLPLLLSILISALIMAAVGFFIQTFLVNKVLDKGSEPALLVMFGLSVIISNLLLNIFGADNQSINNSFSGKNIYSSDTISISASYTVSFTVAVLMIACLTFLLYKTNFGRSVRATADDVMAAELMGVNTKMVYTAVMMIAMMVSAVSGALVGSSFVFFPFSGKQYLIIAFGVVVIGGMGSLMGTLAGGIVLGLSQLIGGYFFGTNFQMAIAYIVLLVILAVRPNGLFAVSENRK